MRRSQPLPTWADVESIAAEHGIVHLGVADAAVLARARDAIEHRVAHGLDGGLPFTFRNPARSTDPTRAMAGARSVIVGARPYRASVEPPQPEGTVARVARYAWVDHYAPLRDGLRAIARRLRAAERRAVVLADDNSIVDREVAYRAGLGWFGKNANLLVAGAGSYFVLGCVITDAEFEPSAAPVADGCGSCTRCVEACPTEAIVAPGVIDANRCLAWLVQRPGTFPEQFRAALGNRLYGCDDCQETCPPTVRLGDRHRVDLSGQQPEAWVEVLGLLDATDDELLARHGRWYLADRDPRWLRRNALIVLGNVGDPSDQRTGATLQRYRSGPDPILAEHAEWAAARLGLPTLPT